MTISGFMIYGIPGIHGIGRLIPAAMNWGWKSRNMVDRYAKFATENLAFAASRIESTRDSKVIPLSRICHVKQTVDEGESDKSLNIMAP
ncbi:hypothetical protein [Nitrosomonas sp.]|uniref:hypothetical protein n=1 Tax=Nitrosomonas sp. TaxID=42353 RepID=UPI002089DE52|nr:MAG: hypothetical protein NMNS02_07730 [Nitrosomonas sp.]